MAGAGFFSLLASPPDYFKDSEASFPPVRRPHTKKREAWVRGSGRREMWESVLACAHPPHDLPFALEPDVTGSGAVGWRPGRVRT